MAVDTTLRRIAHNLAYSQNGNHGNPSLMYRDIENYVRVSGDTSENTWKNVQEPLIVSHHFSNKREIVRVASAPLTTAAIVDKYTVWANPLSGKTFEVLKAGFICSVVESAGGEVLNLENVETATAANGHGGGTTLLSADVNSESGLVANTYVAGALHGTAANLEIDPGARVAIQLDAALEDVADLVTVLELGSINDGITAAGGGHRDQALTLFSNAYGRSYELVTSFVSWGQSETYAAGLGWVLRKHTVGEGAAGGDQLTQSACLANFVTDADDTVVEETILATAITDGTNVIADTERIGMHFTNGTTASLAYPTDLDDLNVVLVLVPTTMRKHVTS